MADYFEIDRLVEELAKIYATACATSWFKIQKNKSPTRQEFRAKVAEFMKHFEYSLSAFPSSEESEVFKSHARQVLANELNRVIVGDNTEVEKRYKYFVEYS